MLIIVRYILLLSFLILLHTQGKAQFVPQTPEEYDSVYNINIRLSKINGVYIPRDLQDAHARIIELSPPESIEKFRMGEEVEVSRKLHFGLGRWMIVNWNFYEGSRFSHLLKSKGLLHPDDMAQFVLRTLHRNLNNKTLDKEKIIAELATKRKEEIEEVYKN